MERIRKMHFTMGKVKLPLGKIAKGVACTAAGFLFINVPLCGGTAPLAMALCSALPREWAALSALGSLIGCFVFMPIGSALQTAAGIAAALTLNAALFHLLPYAKRRLAAAVSAALCTMISGLTLLLAADHDLTSFVNFIGSGFVSGVCTAFLQAAGFAYLKKPAHAVNARDRVSLVAALSMGLMALCVYHLEIFAPARILVCLLVLLCAKWKGLPGGCTAGIFAGAAVALTLREPGAAALFAAGGLLAGMLVGRGSFFMAGGFLFVFAVGALFADSPAFVSMALESLAASTIFFAVPMNFYRHLTARLSPDAPAPAQTVLRAAAGEQLNGAAQAIDGVCDYLERVRCAYEPFALKPTQLTAAQVETGVCDLCAKGDLCPKRSVHERCLAYLAGDALLDADAVAQLSDGNCVQCEAMAESYNRAFLSRISSEYDQMAGKRMRQAAVHQFHCVANVLKDMAQDVQSVDLEKPDLTARAAQVAEDYDLSLRHVLCAQAPNGRLWVEMHVDYPDRPVDTSGLTHALDLACGVHFAMQPPVRHGDYVSLSFYAKPTYRIRLGTAQRAAKGKEYCGDYYHCFRRDDGDYTMVLSDGMGTGGRAAVDAALTCELFTDLIKGGLHFESAARTVNSALQVKPGEESLATLDAVHMNLYNGQGEFFKMGAAASYLCRATKVRKIELHALPMGILEEINPAYQQIDLQKGDLLVLVSDGVCPDGDYNLRRSLALFDGSDLDGLANSIAKEAWQDKENPVDDITVLCAMIEEAS